MLVPLSLGFVILRMNLYSISAAATKIEKREREDFSLNTLKASIDRQRIVSRARGGFYWDSLSRNLTDMIFQMKIPDAMKFHKYSSAEFFTQADLSPVNYLTEFSYSGH